MKSLIKLLAVCLIAVSGNSVMAQKANDKKTKQAAQITELVNNQRFIFNANYVNPFRGGGHALTSEYDLTIGKDSVVAYLPYFGQAYMEAGYGSLDNGLKFTWTKFSYKVTPLKDGFEIWIKPDKQDNAYSSGVQSLKLFVGSNGYGSLQVTNYNRDPIGFNGTIEPRKGDKSQSGL